MTDQLSLYVNCFYFQLQANNKYYKKTPVVYRHVLLLPLFVNVCSLIYGFWKFLDYCLSFSFCYCTVFDLRLLVTPLVFSNMSIYNRCLLVIFIVCLKLLCCLFFFDVRVLNAPLLSSNSSMYILLQVDVVV
jgi:hypothetical protein